LLLACLPALWIVVRIAGARLHLGRLLCLHRDQQGGVQSVSFVLTLPIFLMVVLFIVQISQLMIGTMVVHYAAFAAARSAIVWIPARLGWGHEAENCISSYAIDPQAADQILPILDSSREDYGPRAGGLTYVVQPGSPKYRKIASAAVLACLPVCPSRDLGLELPADGERLAGILETVYRALAPASDSRMALSTRLRNKLAYAMEATSVEIRFYHPNIEPPLTAYPHLVSRRHKDLPEFQFNEVGWQDAFTVKVTHNMALLPGPGRLLAKSARESSKSDGPSGQANAGRDELYVYPITASATLGNEGEKPVIPYVEEPF
jgi:hypothetical protein